MNYTKISDALIIEYNIDNGYSSMIDLNKLQTEIDFYIARLAEIAELQANDPSLVPVFESEILGLQAHIDRFNYLKTI